MRSFSEYNPIAVAVWFFSVTGVAMFCSYPILMAISLSGAVLFFLIRNGFTHGKTHLFFWLLFAVLALANPLVSHNGKTVLFVMNHNPVTLEATLYGVNSAVMIIGVLYWFRSFTQMMTSEKLLYITDNAGEIVADRLVIEKLLERRPELDVCVCVRGGAVINDALYEDAEAAGIPELARVIDNGSSISGTQIQFVGEDLRRELETADVILSKGQGNFETMHGCGLNVYYVFLCKCEWFVKLFHLPMLTGMFLNENRVQTYDINE